MGRKLAGLLAVPAVTGCAVLIGWLVHGRDFPDYGPVYVLVGCVIGIVVSLALTAQPAKAPRENNDFIEQVARRDAFAGAFVDLLLLILVSAVVFAITSPSSLSLAAYASVLAAVGLVDSVIRRWRLNARYGS